MIDRGGFSALPDDPGRPWRNDPCQEVKQVSAELLTKNGPAVSPPVRTSNAREDELREWARQHIRVSTA